MVTIDQFVIVGFKSSFDRGDGMEEWTQWSDRKRNDIPNLW